MPINPRIDRTLEPRDTLRDRLNRASIILRPTRAALDRPVEGELVLSTDGRLLLYTGGGYRQIYPPPAGLEAPPAWVQGQWRLKEEELTAAGVPPGEWSEYA